MIKSTPGKTTTILGRYEDDIRHIIKELDVIESTNMSGNIHGFNVLNILGDLAKGVDSFWDSYDKPWLQAAIDRGDEIIMATNPVKNAIEKNGVMTGFGKEYDFLLKKGYKWVESLGKMVK